MGSQVYIHVKASMGTVDVAQVLEYLPTKSKGLSSNSSTTN
jgi:hypothetical protein